jgi:hypothetical protein
MHERHQEKCGIFTFHMALRLHEIRGLAPEAVKYELKQAQKPRLIHRAGFLRTKPSRVGSSSALETDGT